MGLAAIVILASGSRWIIGWLLVALVSCFMVTAYQKNYKQVAAMLAAVFIGTTVFIFCVMTPWHGDRIFLGPNFLGDIVGIVGRKDKELKTFEMDESVRSRAEMLYACLELFQKKPVFGHGLGYCLWKLISTVWGSPFLLGGDPG